MRRQVNFTDATLNNGGINPGWDFANTWVMYDRHTYPLLRSFMTPLTITATSATKTYDGQIYSSSNGVACGGDACPSAHLFNTAGFVDAATSIGAKNAGTHTIRSDAYSDQQGYILTFINGSVVVNPLALTGSIGAASSTYGSALTPGTVTFDNRMGTDQVSAMANVNTSGLSTSGHPIAGSYTQSSGTALAGSDAGNYTFAGVTTPAANYTVSPLSLSAVIAAGTTPYGSTVTPGAVTFSNRVGSDQVTAPAAVNTSALSTSGQPVAGSYTQSAGASLTGADAGNYTFAGVTTPDANYTVQPLPLTAAIAAGTTTYGSALTSGAVTFSNRVGSDLVSAASSATVNTGALSSSAHAIAGSYTQSVGAALAGADAGNYAFGGLTTTSPNYTINPLALTGSIAAASTTYGSVLTPGMVALATPIGSDQVGATATVNTGMLSSSGHPTVGYYSQSAGVQLSGADAGNYTFAGLTTSTANYTINPLLLTASIAAGSTSYGSTLAPGAVTFSNQVGSDQVTAPAAVNTNALSTSGHPVAGTYTQSAGASLSGADAGNYTFAGLTTPTANYTVSPRSISVVGETAANKIYDGNLVAAINVGSAALAGAMGADQVSVLTSSVTGSFADKNAGAAKLVTVTGNALSGTDAANYSLTQPIGLTADIAPATLTVAAISLYKVFGDKDPAFSYAVGSVVPGDSLDGLLSGSLSRGQGELTGSYPIQLGSLASTSPNYALGYTPGMLMIVPRVQPAPVSRDEPIAAMTAGYPLPYARLGLESITSATHRTDQADLDKRIRQTGNDRLPGLPNLTIIDGGVRMPAGVREH